jgi:hypothetical protein
VDWDTTFGNTDTTNCAITQCGIHAWNNCADGASTLT